MKTPEEIAAEMARFILKAGPLVHDECVQYIASAIQTARNEGFHKGIDAQLKPEVKLPKYLIKTTHDDIYTMGYNDAIQEFKKLNGIENTREETEEFIKELQNLKIT